MAETAIKERPILFSATMVRALLDGRKTQTRRVIKPHPYWSVAALEFTNAPGCWAPNEAEDSRRCPYGVPGDRLWVRESAIYWTYADGSVGGLTPVMYTDDPDHAGVMADVKKGPPKGYVTDGDMGWWKVRSSIHMPRAWSRITLEITDVRVQRLQDISEEDARAEGFHLEGMASGRTRREQFMELWDSINGPGSWASNPWVWALTFKRVEER